MKFSKNKELIPYFYQKSRNTFLKFQTISGIGTNHHTFSPVAYTPITRDCAENCATAEKMGYEEVELIDTTKGVFMSPREALWMGLSGSAILKGKKQPPHVAVALGLIL